MGERSPGSGGAQASSLCAKGHLKWNIKLQKTPRDGTEHGEGEADSQGTGKKSRTETNRDRHGTGLLVEADRGGSGHECDGYS